MQNAKLIFISLAFSTFYSTSFALLEFPTDINSKNIQVQNTNDNFFQNFLRKVNFGGAYNAKNNANTVSDYDAEYKKILNQNIQIQNNANVNAKSNQNNSSNNIQNNDFILTDNTDKTNTNNPNKLLTVEELNIKLTEFLIKLNSIKNSNSSTTKKSDDVIDEDYKEENWSQKRRDDYFRDTGKEYNEESQRQRSENYFRAQDRQVYEKYPEIQSYNANPSTAYDSSAPYINAEDNAKPANLNVTMNDGNFLSPKGSSGELDSRLFKILPGNWLETRGSNFGLNTNGKADRTILSKFAGLTAMSSLSATGPVRVTNTSVCVVSFPREVINYYYGKVNWKDGRSVYRKYKEIAGNRVEIYNYQNGRCAVAPLWEVGPGNKESQAQRFGIDLTYCVKVNMLQTRSGAPTVKYRPVPEGKEGCEDYPSGKVVAPVVFVKKK
jgi:hypothetical protein